MIFTNSWPLITGESILKKSEKKPAFYVKVPDYWYSGSEWIGNHKKDDFRILIMPWSGPYVTYKWSSGYWGVDIVPYLMPNQIIMDVSAFEGVFGIPDTISFIQCIYNNIQKIPNMSKVLALMNIRYVMQRDDLDWEFNRTLSPQEVKCILAKQKNIYLAKRKGRLYFYQIDDQYFLPRIYPSAIPTVVTGDIEVVVPLTYTNYLNGKPVLSFTE